MHIELHENHTVYTRIDRRLQALEGGGMGEPARQPEQLDASSVE